MTNKYLEILCDSGLIKEARSRYKDEAIARGTFDPTATGPKGVRLSNNQIRNNLGLTNQGANSVANSGTKFVPGQAAKKGDWGHWGINQKPDTPAIPSRVENTSRLTGDTLAGSTHIDRLKSNQAGTYRGAARKAALPGVADAGKEVQVGTTTLKDIHSAAKQAPATGGIFSKAMSLAKANPRTAMGLGAVGALWGAHKLGQSSSQNNQGY